VSAFNLTTNQIQCLLENASNGTINFDGAITLTLTNVHIAQQLQVSDFIVYH